MSQQQLNHDLDLLLDEAGFSELQEAMVRVFQSAFIALFGDTSASLDGEAARAASGLRALVPVEKIADPGNTPSVNLWQIPNLGEFQELWQGLIDIATRISYRDDRSQRLVVETLRVLRGDASVWKDLPDLDDMMRDKWINPTFQWHPEEEDHYKLHHWLNLNSFVARLFGSGVFKSYRFPIWQLRQGLEDDLSEEAKGDCTPAEAVDNRVAVASEWLIHAGPALLKLSLLEDQELDDALRRSYRPGVLFSGNPGFNLERWGFWKRRLGELRSEVGEEVVLSVDKAVEIMNKSAAELVRD
ncbi:hypothetical protein B0T16DRAFT_423561 [Cercophora newfieldiana]|uniref:Uncharacterized protein n=1 Tax=Cercophora newfieldiana TaxID=92897 RepID=A0AA39XT08_9PEZI|nr:hypothetical protein B0T16DRAFT_423561 [Cercophora newfieldiana]